ncbi:MAG: hypothetical protein KGQ43_00635 [Acidobacteria bacterium]|nr:hypothetical protein [Acidobacteriota bacterium]
MNRALATVVEALNRVGAPHAVVGSVGATVWGLQRTTIDTDIITVALHERIEELLSSLTGGHIYVPLDDARRILRSGGNFNVLDLDTTEKIDVFVASPNDPFTASRLSRRVRVQIEEVDTWVTTAEDIVLAKLRWRLTTRSERQWRDCLDIAGINDLDVDYLRKWADAIGVRVDLEELLEAIRPLR